MVLTYRINFYNWIFSIKLRFGIWQVCWLTLAYDGSMGRRVYLPIHEWLIFIRSISRLIPSRELKHPFPQHFSRWCSFSKGGTCYIVPWRVYLGLSPLPATVANEGLGWDHLLKYNNPGGDWHPHPRYINNRAWIFEAPRLCLRLLEQLQGIPFVPKRLAVRDHSS